MSIFQTSDSEDLDLEVSDIEVPDYDLEARYGKGFLGNFRLYHKKFTKQSFD